MGWIKKGLIFSVDKISDWSYSHCHKPTPLLIDNQTLRVYFGVRDKNRITRTTFVDIDITDINQFIVKSFNDQPIINPGKIGAFDDSGANVCSVERVGGLLYMYYIGWNPSTTVHTRNSIGLAISEDNGSSFYKPYDGPILDRNKEEPYYTGAVDVKRYNDSWIMYYTSGTRWSIVNGKPEICYHIKYATSDNGIDWVRNNTDSIIPEHEYEAIARPSVVIENDVMKMWYSKRSINGFRDNPVNGYRGGYAESYDGGIRWIRQDHKFGLDTSESGWDSEAIAYPYVIKIRNKYVMLYNGNGFGKSGFGYAVYEP
ncbi:hypothetical protein D3C76_568220 [compost metagenome]|uniref:hypothetical protein n=1 Tax=Paenibacillus sp. FSL R7-0216 TaxID=2921677 RepID=UPI000FBBB726